MIYDIAIIGAGMAGASTAAYVGGDAQVVLLEAESQPGYHTTGRSAAFYSETYGGANVQPLTTASKPWYFSTLSESSREPFVRRHGALHVGWNAEAKDLEAFVQKFQPLTPNVQLIDPARAMEICDVLRPDGVCGAVYDPDCCDIDVAGVHQHFLKQAKAFGVQLRTDFKAQSIRYDNGIWHIESGDLRISARILVNAAGAWGDQVASLCGIAPLGLRPLRRTVGVFDVAGETVDPGWPLVLDFQERFYFKPESGKLLISPADETLCPPCDVQPEAEDIARAAHRVEQATKLKLPICRSKWAGLRTFAPDRAPVYGFDPQCPSFFWCVGQGGFGIQTAPAAGELCASLLLGRDIPETLQTAGVSAARYSPARFLKAA